MAEADKLVDLTEGLNISDLLSGAGATFEINFDNLVKEFDESNTYQDPDGFDHVNPECCGLVDEDTYEEGEPFEIISKKMTDVIPDGKIKKRILREGYGDVLPDKSSVTIHYNAYVEYSDEPYDSTYLRKRPFTFILNTGGTLPGLDIGVGTMKLNEKAQFMFHYDYAYGKFGCPPRVPSEATVLFEVEIKNCVDSGACATYAELEESKQKNFNEIYKYCLALCDKAKDLFKKGMIKQAIREYNTAVSKLEYCTLTDYKSQEKQQELLFRLYNNLVISNTKIQDPRRACTNYNKVAKLCRGTSLKIPAKIFYQHGRALMMLGDYDGAQRQLSKAQKMEPQDRNITKEFLNLDLKRKENFDREINVAKVIFNNTKINQEPHEVVEITEDFKNNIKDLCKDLNKDNNSTQYSLPEELTVTELGFVKDEVVKHNLKLEKLQINGTDKYYVCKVPDKNEN